MPEYLAPGVYVEEIPQVPKPIEGVGTSAAAFLGETERGPTWPRLVTSFSEFARIFGGTCAGAAQRPDKFMPFAVDGFFENGGRRLYVCRVTGAEALHASRSFGSATLYAIGAGKWGNHLFARIDAGSPRAAEAQPLGEIGEERAQSSGKPAEQSGVRAGVRADVRADAQEAGQSERFRLRVAYWANPPAGFVPFDVFDVANGGTAADAATGTGADAGAGTGASAGTGTSAGTGIGRRAPITPAPTAVESHDDLSLDPNSPDFFEKRLSPRSPTGSALVYLDFGGVTPNELPAFQGGALTGGEDGDAVTASDFIGKEGEGGRVSPQGLQALSEAEFAKVSIVHAPHPGPASDAIYQAIVTHCESNRFRFAVLDCNRVTSSITSLDPRARLDSRNAAFYCPWIKVADPSSGAPTFVPPGGHVAGIYVRTDMERGVHVAPANQVVVGALDVEVAIREAEQELLNPRGVNVIRQFAGRGIRVWGARTLSSDAEWKYVNVRRLFIYLERSIEQGLQWVVFEPNGDALWLRVRESVRNFLRAQWKSGALLGRTEDEAFFVKCDASTMTQGDLEKGRLVVEVGVAAIRAGEFVVIRIGTRTADWAGD